MFKDRQIDGYYNRKFIIFLDMKFFLERLHIFPFIIGLIIQSFIIRKHLRQSIRVFPELAPSLQYNVTYYV